MSQPRRAALPSRSVPASAATQAAEVQSESTKECVTEYRLIPPSMVDAEAAPTFLVAAFFAVPAALRVEAVGETGAGAALAGDDNGEDGAN